jgi:hypothetical protein
MKIEPGQGPQPLPTGQAEGVREGGRVGSGGENEATTLSANLLLLRRINEAAKNADGVSLEAQRSASRGPAPDARTLAEAMLGVHKRNG